MFITKGVIFINFGSSSLNDVNLFIFFFVFSIFYANFRFVLGRASGSLGYAKDFIEGTMIIGRDYNK